MKRSLVTIRRSVAGLTPLDFSNDMQRRKTDWLCHPVTSSRRPHDTENLTGLTLVELLITVSLVALIAGAVVATFAGGIQVWQRLQVYGAREQWVQTAFHQLRRELRNARRFEPIRFEGTYDVFSFPALVSTGLEEGLQVEEVGQVGYFFDSPRRTLCQSQHPYRVLRRFRLKDSCSPVLTGIDRLRFSYPAVDSDTNSSSWSDSWSSSQPPLAVKVEVRFHDSSIQRPHVYSLIVHLPTAAVR